jgi:hypothetical protein
MPILLALAAAASTPPAVSVPEQPALTEAIEARDAALFELVFTGPCDPERLRSMVADDLEFYHDKAGFAARSGDAFVAKYRGDCDARQKPNPWRSRRELVPGTLHVDPVPGWGAIETGEHLFYEREGEGPEKLAGRARFAQLWVLGADGEWRLSRVFSYGHRPAE